MGLFKKTSKILAGVVSLSLALGTFSSFESVSSIKQNTAFAASKQNSELYEYDLDVYIDDVQLRRDYNIVLTLCPKIYDHYHSYERFEVEIINPEYRGLDKYTEEDIALWNKTLGFAKLLTKGINVNMTVVSDIEYKKSNDYDDAINLPFDLKSNYVFCGIKSLSSPYIQFYGDINTDGVVDTFDTVIYRMEISGTNTSELTVAQKLNADINKDDIIDEEDLEQVMNFVLGSSKEFNSVGKLRSIDLCADIEKDLADGKSTDAKFASAEMKLGVNLLKKCFDPTSDKNKNMLISPLSISAALAMTANGADGQTLSEMENVIGNGLTIDEINEYMAYYIANLPDGETEKLYLANSIWFRDDPKFAVFDDFLKKNVRYYDAQLYKAPFDDSTVGDVNSWVNENTRGMIPSLLKKGDLDPTDQKIIMMMLINTLYFENDWAIPYYSTNDGTFTDYNGVEHAIERMDSKEAHYYDLGDADAFDKSFEGGNYKFVGIMPKEKDIIDYVNDLDADKLLEGLSEYEDPKTVDLYVMIPKFKYSYNTKFKEILPELGMKNAFDPLYADFSKINDLSIEDAPALYIDDVLHKTRIEVTEKGVRAAAVTAVMMAAGSAMPVPKKEIHIELDKPFVYMILDKNNVPLFIGAASQLEKE